MLLADKMSQTHTASINEEDTLIDMVEQSSISDKLGILGSGLCLIHCLIFPLLLPFFTSTNSETETHAQGLESWFHGIIFPALLLFAIHAFSKGYFIHKSKLILCSGLFGILLLSLGLVSEYFHQERFISPEGITSIGSIILVSAHIFNILKIRNCNQHIHSESCTCLSNLSKNYHLPNSLT